MTPNLAQSALFPLCLLINFRSNKMNCGIVLSLAEEGGEVLNFDGESYDFGLKDVATNHMQNKVIKKV